MTTTTKARPILMSGHMARALDAGIKTQTRRAIKRPLCPYGAVGDLLWVREPWRELDSRDGWRRLYEYRERAEARGYASEHKWRPSMYMPIEASRITLRITKIGVQRLQDISAADAIPEGIERDGEGWKSYEIIHRGRHKGQRHPHAVVPNRSPITSYKELWESINGEMSWRDNPAVWCLTFDVIHNNVTEIQTNGTEQQ